MKVAETLPRPAKPHFRRMHASLSAGVQRVSVDSTDQ